MAREELITRSCKNTWNEKIFKQIEKTLDQEPCEDAVNREDVIKAIDRHTFDTDDGLRLDDDITIILEEIPPINPKQETVTEFADRCRECGREKVLDKIRAEIKDASHGKWYVGRLDGKSEEVLLLEEVLQIIDKYKESEDKE